MSSGRSTSQSTPTLSHTSRCLERVNITHIHRGLPRRCGNLAWLKLFSASSRRRSSLDTYFNRCTDFQELYGHYCEGCVTAVRDTNGAVFGCYTSKPWENVGYVNNDKRSFLFKVQENETNLYNMGHGECAIQDSGSEYISLRDGNGKCVLNITSAVEHGFSWPSQLFHSPKLSSQTNFTIENLEIYFLVPFEICSLLA